MDKEIKYFSKFFAQETRRILGLTTNNNLHVCCIGLMGAALTERLGGMSARDGKEFGIAVAANGIIRLLRDSGKKSLLFSGFSDIIN